MRRFSIFVSLCFFPGLVFAEPIAGVDFSDPSGAFDQSPDDLNLLDSVSVSTTWSFVQGGISGDANANTGRQSVPVGKLDGFVNDGVPPAIGATAPTEGVHTFSITIGSEALDLEGVSFDFSRATGGINTRWIAFRTSLDDTIIYSSVGLARPALSEVEIPLTDQKYKGLQNQTVEFFWYAGGEGSGDIDIDSIIVDGLITTDLDSDGLPDAFEQLIIDADPADGLATIGDVLPGDDYDMDQSSNINEFMQSTDPLVQDTDEDGLFDGVETNDGSFDDLATDTGTDPLNPDTDGDNLEDGVETNDGTFDDIASDTGTNPLLVDTDGDLMSDDFEVNNGLNPSVDDGADDTDMDGRTNIEEFAVGTNPTNPDTDDDGLKDGAETNTMTFVSAADTGTDPLNPDTDGDGLKDGAETNDGTFNGLTDTGSSPLNENTDGDNFRDGAEVTIHNTDPTDANSQSSSNLTVLFLDADGSGTQGADEVAVTLLEDKFGIDKVTISAASTITTGDELSFGLLVMSSTPSSGDLRGKFVDSIVPIVNWEEAVSDNNNLGEFGGSTEVFTKSNETTQIMLADHPISAGFPEVIDFFQGEIGETTSTATVFGDLDTVATAVDGPTGNAMIIAIEEGSAVDPAVGTMNNTAPARRVLMPFTDNTLNFISPDGLALFASSLDWAIGATGGSAPLQIVSFSVDSSNIGDKTALIEFTSRLGRDYILLSSTNLEDLVSGGGTAVTTITGADVTTQFEINFNTFGFSGAEEKRFFTIMASSQ